MHSLKPCLVIGMQVTSTTNTTYALILEVIPNTQFLESMIEILDTKLLKKLVDYIDWSTNNLFIKNVHSSEEAHDITVLERSVYGAALSQGRKVLYFEA